MPYASDKQRAWMHIHEPAIARKWDKGEHSTKGPHHRMPRRKGRKARRKSKRA